jgi:predicted glycosyltransferase
LFHVQYLLGIGHLQRSLRIAEALRDLGIAVTLVQGGPPLAEVALPRGLDLVQLPPIRARDATFALVDMAGKPVSEALRAARRERLLAAYAKTRPDEVVIEGFPFARRAFRFELDPLIAAARADRPRPRVICSVRDIPTVRDDPGRRAAIVDRVNAEFDAVLVHGDPNLIAFDLPFPPAARIADRLHYTGYVANAAPSSVEAPVPEGEVLVSIGGGAAGHALLAAALGARRRGCLVDRGWRLLTGAGVPPETLAALRRAAPDGVVVERFRPDFAALLRACHVSVSQAGYNTVLDVLAAGARSVLVPFAAERETEQQIRAERLAAHGACVLVREAELSPETLAAAIERAAGRAAVQLALDTGGAGRSAQLIAALITTAGARTFSRAASTV